MFPPLQQTEAPVSRLFPSDQDSGTDTEGTPEQVTSPQRTFDPKTSATCCTCKGACANSRCRCVKVKLGCSDGCACMPSRCKNNRGARKDGSQTGHENGVESADMVRGACVRQGGQEGGGWASKRGEHVY